MMSLFECSRWSDYTEHVHTAQEFFTRILIMMTATRDSLSLSIISYSALLLCDYTKRSGPESSLVRRLPSGDGQMLNVSI